MKHREVDTSEDQITNILARVGLFVKVKPRTALENGINVVDILFSSPKDEETFRATQEGKLRTLFPEVKFVSDVKAPSAREEMKLIPTRQTNEVRYYHG